MLVIGLIRININLEEYVVFSEEYKMHKNMMSKEQIIKKPVSIITAFSESTVNDLLSLQADYMLKQLNSVMLKSRALSQVENPKGTVKHQLSYLEGLGNDLSEITGQEIGFLKFYKNKLIDIVDKNMKEVPLISVSYRLTEGEQISVVNVEKDDAAINSLHMKRVRPVHSGEHHA